MQIFQIRWIDSKIILENKLIHWKDLVDDVLHKIYNN